MELSCHWRRRGGGGDGGIVRGKEPMRDRDDWRDWEVWHKLPFVQLFSHFPPFCNRSQLSDEGRSKQEGMACDWRRRRNDKHGNEGTDTVWEMEWSRYIKENNYLSDWLMLSYDRIRVTLIHGQSEEYDMWLDRRRERSPLLFLIDRRVVHSQYSEQLSYDSRKLQRGR